ncbi:MAG: adenosylcobinamide-phosphate synthase CbiB [Janthinobacterium lividum]
MQDRIHVQANGICQVTIVDTLVVAVVALLADAAFGYPDRLFRLIGHPVVWIGALIGWLDRRFNRDMVPDPRQGLNVPDVRRRVWGIVSRRRVWGMMSLLVLAGVPTVAAWLVERACLEILPHAAGLLVLGVVAGSLSAQRSLFTHVRDVLAALERGGLGAGRTAVARIVGRDPEVLDEAGVVRAAIESLAENFSDGVVAPLLWCAAFGLPGMVFYKAVNTADSMIGHLTPRHAAFGWASARLDDLVNLPASRVSALWITLAAMVSHAASASGAVRAVRRDAGRHRSPNAGWPEAAMAGALGLSLAGPRIYDGKLVDDAWMGRGRIDAGTEDLRRALAVYRRACMVEALILIGLIVVAWWTSAYPMAQ